MSNFYEDWFALEGKAIEEKRRAKKAIYPNELQWIRTRQDFKAALLVAPETGFRTLGGLTMLSEIPEGWKTGKHSHGEEAMYILKGKGFSIIDEQRFDWEDGACLRIPFGAIHQHFNQGDTPVHYFSALAPHLEFSCLVAKFQQFEDCGEIDSTTNQPARINDYDKQGRRLVLNRKDATIVQRGEVDERVQDAFWESHPSEMHKGNHGKMIKMMGSYDDFVAEEVEITDVFVDGPKVAGQKHAHMEAMLYIIDGEGYTIIDEEKFPWSPGTALHIQGPQTVHQHFATGEVPSQMLRTHFGIRKYIQPIAQKTFPYLYLGEARPL